MPRSVLYSETATSDKISTDLIYNLPQSVSQDWATACCLHGQRVVKLDRSACKQDADISLWCSRSQPAAFGRTGAIN